MINAVCPLVGLTAAQKSFSSSRNLTGDVIHRKLDSSVSVSGYPKMYVLQDVSRLVHRAFVLDVVAFGRCVGYFGDFYSCWLPKASYLGPYNL